MTFTTADWDYTRREFESLPQGYVATTEHFSITSGKLTENTLCGLGVCSNEFQGDVAVYKLPAAASDVSNFSGVLLFDMSNPRVNGQPQRSHNAVDMVNVMREGEVVVYTSTAVASNSKVYLVHTTNGAELKGMFRGTASANCTLIPNARFKKAASAGKAVLAIFNPSV